MSCLQGLKSITIDPTYLTQIRQKPNVEVIVGEIHHTVEHLLRILASNHILSVPVFVNDQLKEVAFVEIATVISGFVKAHDNQNPNSLTQDIVMKKVIGEFFCLPLSSLLDLMPRAPIVQVGSFSLFDAIELFCNHQRLHRVPLFQNDSICSILSQSDIIRCLYVSNVLGDLLNVKIMDTGVVKEKVFSLSPNNTVWDALVLLFKQQISSIALVREGKLVGSFSVIDLRV
eukprot:TRINITY_DN2592_c0_g1_i2.p1 TRINITY_DN2592_c0_g1~~TRINITY_DN2592_c0_g1_i2.p1  ORF type:complete len:230 (+),score=29.22 TRINITY_DN2592_c0_g1_i2:133-822(+)